MHYTDADLNIQDIEGNTPLHIATRHSYQDSVKLLLGKGANPNIEDKDGNTPFRLAILIEHPDMVKSFLENDKYGTDVNLQDKKTGDSLVFDAVATRTTDIADSVIKNKKVDLSIRNKKGMTALHEAACYGKNDTVNLLLEQGVNASDIDYKGRDPLHFAGLNMWRPVNANDDQSREDGSNYSTIEKPDENVIAIINTLIKHNIQDLRTQLQKKHEQLHKEVNEEASIKIQREIGNLELERNTKKKKYVNIEDENGNTPLFYAIESRKPDVITKFLEEDAEVAVTDKKGYTPFHYAIKSKSPKILELLTSSSVNSAITKEKVEDVFKKYAPSMEYFIKLFGYSIPRSITDNVLNPIIYRGLSAKPTDEQIETILPNSIKGNKESYNLIKNEVSKMVESAVGEIREILSVRDKEGNTLLHHAIKWGCGEEILDFLVKNGVDVNAKNKNGVAPIHIAAKYGKPSQMEFFIKNKADLNVRCGKLSKSVIDNIGKEKELSGGATDTYINVQDGNVDASSTVDIKDNTEHKKATAMSLAAEGSHSSTVTTLLSEGVKPNIEDSRGWLPLHIAIKRACDPNCSEEERQEKYAMIRNLAFVSNVEFLMSDADKKSETYKNQFLVKVKNFLKDPLGVANNKTVIDENQFFVKIKNSLKEALKVANDKKVQKKVAGAFRDVMLQVTRDDQEISRVINKILKEAIESKSGEKPPTAPTSKEASAPALNENFYTKINVQEIPDLYPDLYLNTFDYKTKELAVGNYRVDEWDPQGNHSQGNHRELQSQREVTAEITSEWAKGLKIDKAEWGKEGNISENSGTDVWCQNKANAISSSSDQNDGQHEQKQPTDVATHSDNNLDTQNAEQKAELATEISSEKQPISTENGASGNLNTQGVERKEESTEPKTKLENLSTRVIQSNVSELNDNSALVKLAKDQQVKQNEFLSRVSEAQNMTQLNKIVSEALKSGVRLNFSDDKEHNFTDYVIEKIYELNNIKKDPEITSNIICKLASRGAVLNSDNKIDFVKFTKGLELGFQDHKINVRKANEVFKKRFDGFKKIVESSINKGELQNLEIDNTTFSLEYSKDSIVDVAKVTDGAKGLGLNQGDIAFGGNIVKIGKNAVEFEIKENGKRNYTGVSTDISTDISDDGAVIITFRELEVRLRSDPKNKDRTIVELDNASRKRFDQLKDEDKKKIGENCLLGGLPVCDAIRKESFVGSGKLKSSETHGTKDTVEKFWQNRVAKAIIADSPDTRGIEVSK